MIYYTGDNVPLKFTITDAAGAITPSLVEVSILKPHNLFLDHSDAEINGNIVSYLVPTSVTNEGGHYKAYFVITLPEYGGRSHKIEFDVNPNPEENR